MDQRLKYGIMSYITGNVFVTDHYPRDFIDCRETTDNLYTKLAEKGITPGTTNILTTDTTTNYLIYGTYIKDNTNYGYIAILDQNGNVLDILTTYDTGTMIARIESLSFDENGNIYGLDYINGKYRVILLNNVALETPRGYFCKLRSSYYINLTYEPKISHYSGTSPIKKTPGEPSYFLFGTNGTKTTLIKFINNVGMPNEWYQYDGHSIGNDNVYTSDFLLETIGDTTSAYIYYVLNNSKEELHNEVFNGTTLGDYQYLDTNARIDDVVMEKKYSVYYSIKGSGNDFYIYKYEKNADENYTDIMITYAEDFVSNGRSSLALKDNVLFVKIEGFDANNKYLICLVYDRGETTYSQTYTGSPDDFINTGCAVQKTFSLYKYIVQGKNTLKQPSIVIYDNMYSGEAYTDYGSAASQKGELYSNGYIVFARPLYDKQIFNNKTTATLEIPNSYLNDIPITKKEILSRQNNVLITNNEEIQKNIYETLFLNFTTTLSVIDEDTDTIYQNTANYITKNINVGEEENYNNTFLGKIRVNYLDHEVIMPITWQQVDYTHYQMETIIDNTTKIQSIDFLSNDESTIYMTKTNFELIGTYFKLTQKIRIE